MISLSCQIRERKRDRERGEEGVGGERGGRGGRGGRGESERGTEGEKKGGRKPRSYDSLFAKKNISVSRGDAIFPGRKCSGEQLPCS